MSEQFPPTPPQQNDFAKGFKLALGGCAALLVVAVVIIGGLFMLGAIPLALLSSKPANQTTSPPPINSESANKNNSIDWVAKFEALSEEERLQKRLAAIEGGHKSMMAAGNAYSEGAQSSLTGVNQDVMTITLPALRNAPKALAENFAIGMFSPFVDDKQFLKEFIALGFTAIKVTDGKRSWTKILKTGDLIERES
jgi:hypothetical protein